MHVKILLTTPARYLSADAGLILSDAIAQEGLSGNTGFFERSRCYQKDLLEQLHLIESTLHQLKDSGPELLKESLHALLEKNSGFIQKIQLRLLAEDEEKINEFLELEVKPFFTHLSPGTDIDFAPVTHYLQSIDPVTGHLNKNRRDFDESIGKINATISRYLEAEQDKIQQIY